MMKKRDENAPEGLPQVTLRMYHAPGITFHAASGAPARALGVQMRVKTVFCFFFFPSWIDG
jgi:hypothetical protein